MAKTYYKNHLEYFIVLIKIEYESKQGQIGTNFLPTGLTLVLFNASIIECLIIIIKKVFIIFILYKMQ